MYEEVATKILYVIRQHGTLYPLEKTKGELIELLKTYFPEPLYKPTLYVGDKEYVSDKPQNLD